MYSEHQPLHLKVVQYKDSGKPAWAEHQNEWLDENFWMLAGEGIACFSSLFLSYFFSFFCWTRHLSSRLFMQTIEMLALHIRKNPFKKPTIWFVYSFNTE